MGPTIVTPMPPEQVKKVIALIMSSDTMTLHDYCAAVLKHSPPTDRFMETAEFLMECHMNDADSENSSYIYERLLRLAKANVLPELRGAIHLSSFCDVLSEYSHDEYIAPHEDALGFINVWVMNGVDPEGKEIQVPSSTVNAVAHFQGSEIITTSTEVPGHYFIIYDDGMISTLATSDDAFIKAMCSLELMRQPEVFRGVLEQLINSTKQYNTIDPESVNEIENPARETLRHILSEMDMIMLHYPNMPADVIECFERWRNEN